MVADFSYHFGNSCNNLGDSIRSGCDNIPTLVVLVSGDAEGDDDLSPLRTQKVLLQRQGRLCRRC
jgi:hypothetical protein